MSLKEIFRAELDFLKKDGKYFSQIHPNLSRFLSDDIIDPEAERIIESFAFLTARLKEKIQDHFPELTESMIQLLWPNYLRPLPSSTILRFEPKERAITTKHIIPKGTMVLSKPVDGTNCRFQTTTDVAIYPLILNSVKTKTTSISTLLELQLENISGSDFDSLECDELSFYLSGSDYSALTCYQWIFNYLDKISIFTEDQKEFLIPLDYIKYQGFSEQEALIPYPENSFSAYRLLQEFFFFPKKFYFFKLIRLNELVRYANGNKFKLVFKFNRAFPEDINLSIADFTLYSSPIINLFSHDALPINQNRKKDAYPIIPTGNNKSHFAIFDVNKVTSVRANYIENEKNEILTYDRFESFGQDLNESNTFRCYKVSLKENIKDGGCLHYISFITDENMDINSSEIVSIELKCTNNHLPEYLGIGDIHIPSQDTPSYINFKNIMHPVMSIKPIIDDKLHWRLISNLSLNYMSLNNLNVFKEAIFAYDFLAINDVQAKRRTEQRLNSIKDIKTYSVNRIIKGVTYRGLKTVLKIDSRGFLCEGEVFLFGSVLSEFFRLFGTINSFHELEIVNTNNNEIFKWKRKMAVQPIL